MCRRVRIGGAECRSNAHIIIGDNSPWTFSFPFSRPPDILLVHILQQSCTLAKRSIHHFITHNAQNPLHTFPRNFPADGKVGQLVMYLSCTLRSWWRTCYVEVANMLRACYGKTGVMDFNLKAAQYTMNVEREARQIWDNNNLKWGL